VGYDHISGCVGGSLAAGAGADYLCYINPSEDQILAGHRRARDWVRPFRAAIDGDRVREIHHQDKAETWLHVRKVLRNTHYGRISKII
jgi:thiamine biosynthesis protein ThiC